ncbi:MAG: hypothetical protein AB7H92_14020 [Microbacteriaceae bacterium]
MIRADATFTGPLFDGNVDGVVGRHMTAAQDTVGRALVAEVQQRLDSVLVNPTGAYRSGIGYRVLQGDTLITDRKVYGPWLEGVSSRNTRTRFKGYATFRRVTEAVQHTVPDIVQAEVEQLVKELG